MHFGIVTPPVSGHLHPFGALGRELIRRGHRVTVFQMPDMGERVRAEGLEFREIGCADHPPGSLPLSLAALSRLDGLAALRFTVAAVRSTTEMVCRDAPAAVNESGVDALLVDQMEPAGGAVAEHLGIPFITVCNALLLNTEPSVPPPFTDWSFQKSWWSRLRNRFGYALSRQAMRPVSDTVDRYREKWRLPKLRKPEDSFSRIAQICQQPRAFDYPRKRLPTAFHYVGPLRGPSHKAIHFPWERLDGRPLVYASLGTLQNRKVRLFRLFAEACRGLDVQLVLTHGGGLDERTAANLPGDPLVVSYAPQLEVLSKAALTLTHAGLNTVLDSLSCGVPLIALPITYEQPAIARRIEWTGAGESLARERLDANQLRGLIRKVLHTPRYRERSRQMQECIAQAGGVKMAAEIIQNSIF